MRFGIRHRVLGKGRRSFVAENRQVRCAPFLPRLESRLSTQATEGAPP